MADCLFCRLIAGEIPATIVYQNDHVVAFKDITPQAPTHVLVVPRRHIATLNDLVPGDDALVGEIVRAAAAIAKESGLATAGIEWSSTATPRPGRRFSTCTCICSAAGR